VASVLHLFRAPKRRLPMEELPETRAVQDSGLEGCAHARPGGKRQVLLVDWETLDAMSLRPGVIRENITTKGLNVNNLAPGQQLRVGKARLEVSAVCAPCHQLDKVRPGLPE
jgi:MOSC domain-containing protein YiiM